MPIAQKFPTKEPYGCGIPLAGATSRVQAVSFMQKAAVSGYSKSTRFEHLWLFDSLIVNTDDVLVCQKVSGDVVAMLQTCPSCHCEEGVARRGNLVQAPSILAHAILQPAPADAGTLSVTALPCQLSQRESQGAAARGRGRIATAPLGPRNDKTARLFDTWNVAAFTYIFKSLKEENE